MTKEAKQVKKRAIAESRKSFLEPTSLKDIHYGDVCFFEDIELWGLRPIKILMDVIADYRNRGEDDPEAEGLLLNDVRVKIDNLLDNFKRWGEEERNHRKEAA